jgi:hypothetical protein
MAADTSSSAAASTPVVWLAATVWAALRPEPMVAKSVAAEVIISGAAITNDIPHLQAARDNPAAGWRSVLRRSYAESGTTEGTHLAARLTNRGRKASSR